MPAIELVNPFPPEFHDHLYQWMMQFPERTMDDFWPSDPQDFADAIKNRSLTEETFLIVEDGSPVGFIGYCRVTPHLGSLRGVCFTQEVHGNGTPLRALRKLLQMEFDCGVYKVMAFPFSDNPRAIAFYKKLGAMEEGIFSKHTLRGGKAIDLQVLAFFASADGYRSLT